MAEGPRDRGPLVGRVPAYRLVGGSFGVVTAATYLAGAGRSLDYDSAETVGFFVLAPSPFDALRRQRAFNNHPLFSFLEAAVHWLTGSADEVVLRVLPILFGAAAVAVVSGWAAKRFGLLAGLVAGAVMAVNPMFAELSRAVRGYSLLVLAAVGSTLLLGRLLDDRSQRGGGIGLAYAALLAVGLATHLYMGPVVVLHMVVALRARVVDLPFVRLWALAAVIGGAFYVRIAARMVDSVDARGTNFKPDFPVDLASELAGGTALAAALLAPVLAAGVLALRRPYAISVTVTTLLAVVAAWLSAGTDLAPRFFIWLVPLVAAVVAAGVAARPWVALFAGASVVASLFSVAPDWTTADNPYPEAARLIDVLADHGRTACVLEFSVPPLLAYTDRFEGVTQPEQLERCDAAITVAPDLEEDLVDAAASRFPVRVVLEAPRLGAIYTVRTAAPLLK